MPDQVEPQVPKSSKFIPIAVAVMVGTGLLVVLAAASPWILMYRNGHYFLGSDPVEAATAFAQVYEPTISGVVWARRDIPADEQARAEVDRGPAPIGEGRLTSGVGSVELTGTKDGQKLFRLTMSPGPAGIGWQEDTYQFKPDK